MNDDENKMRELMASQQFVNPESAVQGIDKTLQ